MSQFPTQKAPGAIAGLVGGAPACPVPLLCAPALLITSLWGLAGPGEAQADVLRLPRPAAPVPAGAMGCRPALALLLLAAVASLHCCGPAAAAPGGLSALDAAGISLGQSARHLLQGFDATAGALQCSDASKPYEALLTINTPGRYRFRVKAKGSNGDSTGMCWERRAAVLWCEHRRLPAAALVSCLGHAHSNKWHSRVTRTACLRYLASGTLFSFVCRGDLHHSAGRQAK